MPLVSVIIATYNRVSLLNNAIVSVINQTYSNLEIIVVDDGSTDGTGDFVEQFGSKIQYFFKNNGGVSSARNYGIKKSSGELIAFLDSDDEWLPEKIEKQISFLCANPDFGMVLCDCNFIDSNRKITSRTFRRIELPHDGHIPEHVFKSPYLIPSTVLVRKHVLDDTGLFDENIRTAEDLDLHLRIAWKYKIGLLTEPLTCCMSGHEGLSMLSRTYDDHVYVLERFAKKHLDGRGNKGLIASYISAANGKYWLNEWRAGIVYSLKALRCIGTFKDVLPVSRTFVNGLKFFLMFLKRKTQLIH